MESPHESPHQGRFDVHSHLLPGVDDGCASIAESLDCARKLAAAGYTHSFCTPHIWPNLPGNNRREIVRRVDGLQRRLDEAEIALRLFPGGEINLTPDYMQTPPKEVPTFNMAGKYALIDLWADKLPDFFEPSIRWFQSLGLTVILAHPERMRAVQDEPDLADKFAELGVLLQGNLQCFSDPAHASTRVTVECYLREGRYFLLGCDLHNLSSLGMRLKGLERAIALAGQDTIDRLTVHNPRLLLETA